MGPKALQNGYHAVLPVHNSLNERRMGRRNKSKAKYCRASFSPFLGFFHNIWQNKLGITKCG